MPRIARHVLLIASHFPLPRAIMSRRMLRFALSSEIRKLREGMPAHRVLDPEDETAITALLRKDALRLQDGRKLPDTNSKLSRAFESAGQIEQLGRWFSELPRR